MLKETLTDREQHLRAFMDTDCTMHLKVWYEKDGSIENPDDIREFRLTYNLIDDGHGIMWRKTSRDGHTENIYAHVAVDDGEEQCLVDENGKSISFLHKQSPTLNLNGVFEDSDVKKLADDFLTRAKNADQVLIKFVYEKILGFPEEQFVSKPHS